MLISLRTLLMGFLLVIATLATARSATICNQKSGSLTNTTSRPVVASIGDRILGRWYFPMRDSDIEIYRENGRYFAKIVAVSEATAAEYGTMTNKILLTDLIFAKNEWAGGKIIHPQSGNRFDVFLKLLNTNTLIITAYKGCRLFNRAYTLTRI